MGRTPSGHLKNDLDVDAWGRQKAIIDRSIFHGMFTFNVPVTAWYETINDVVQTGFTNCTSVNGALNVVPGATLNDDTYLRTYRNPRYEPNRGMLYSTAAIIENPNAAMVRRWGTFTKESGVFFELDHGVLYGVVRTTVDSVTTDDRNLIDYAHWNIDLSKGNVFDVQYQWRGVGNYVFFINLGEVRSTSYLGELSRLSMFNPALPIAFQAINEGANDKMIFGCVDVSAEGGEINGKSYGSIGIENQSGQVAISGFDQPILAARSKTTVNSLINTRDTLSLLASAYSDQRAIFKIWNSRDFTAIADGTQSWTDFGDGHLEYMVVDPGAGTPMTFDTAKAQLIFSCRVDIDQTYATSALFEGRTEIYQTPGDMLVFTMHRETGAGANVGVTYEFAEEI